MSGRVITWEPGMAPLGSAVIAIGVFDGVHLGHRKLLAAAVREGRRLNAAAIALTFDRDPDQVVTPEAAAPQLLTLQDKCRFILDAGVQRVLVVPFTPELAATPPEEFLDELLLACCDVKSVHVGEDFRFGAKAAGTIETLLAWAAEHGAEVRAHELFEVGGEPVTSTRIRALVSHGQVAEANALLGRATRIVGSVRRGREQGRVLGFPTANVVPQPHAALPADGVYAGRAVLAEGRSYPAAISVGVPPSFPEARDYLEAHLIGFEGDLYGATLTLEFLDKLRDQRSFGSLDELSAAIAADVDRAQLLGGDPVEIGRPFDLNPFTDVSSKALHSVGLDRDPSPYFLEDGSPVVEDPAALAEATAEVSGVRIDAAYDDVDEDWVELVGRRRLSGLFGEAGYTAALVTAPLQAAGIPFRWDPYPPEHMPGFRVGYGAVDRPFSLLVPQSRLAEAREIMDVHYLHRRTAPPTSEVLMPSRERSDELPSFPAVRTPAPGVRHELRSRTHERARLAWRVIAWIVLAATFLLYAASRR